MFSVMAAESKSTCGPIQPRAGGLAGWVLSGVGGHSVPPVGQLKAQERMPQCREHEQASQARSRSSKCCFPPGGPHLLIKRYGPLACHRSTQPNTSFASATAHLAAVLVERHILQHRPKLDGTVNARLPLLLGGWGVQM